MAHYVLDQARRTGIKSATSLGSRFLSTTSSVTTPPTSNVQLRRVLILSKQTRYETEVSNVGGVGVSQSPAGKQSLRREISGRGLNYERLNHSYYSHVNSVNDLVTELDNRNIEYQVVTATRDGVRDFPESYQHYDAVISAGGDGTFLKAASEMYTSDVPLIGVNTDPNTSKGALCTIQSSLQFGRHLDQLAANDFDWQTHSRIRVQLETLASYQQQQHDGSDDEDNNSVGSDGSDGSDGSGSAAPTSKWTQLKQVALNEIFFAERNVAHPIQHEIIVDEDQSSADVQLSSGVLICTGTGSSAWMANAMSLDEHMVRRVLDMARDVVGELDTNKLDDHTVSVISESLNRHTNFDIGSSDIQYFVREVVNNGLRSPCRNRRGAHKSVTIRSRGWDPTMTLDGIHTYPLPAGQRAHFDTDPSVALRTCTFV